MSSNRMFNKVTFFLFCFIWCANFTSAQDITLADIKKTLLENPPNSGDVRERKEAILALDNILKNDSCRISQYVKDYYADMMNKVNQEMKVFEGAATVYTMYNHGYIIMTQDLTFAFDLVPGYWDFNLFPSEITAQINVLFISHSHGDHYNYRIANQVKEQGGVVIVPSAIASLGTMSMEFGDTVSMSGLKIKMHEGLHSVPNAIFEVTTANGIKFLHTGDNQTSAMLPEIDDVDVLLLNAWVNESGTTSAVAGMQNSMHKIHPALMIPGHLQELGHAYNPEDMTTRVPYEWVFEVNDIPVNSEILVMAWGEKYDLPASMATNIGEIVEHNHNSFYLPQNYPNPFNPSTTIAFTLPRSEYTTLKIYNTLGAEVATLVSDQLQAGLHTYEFDGSKLASGLYYYQATAGAFRDVKKMILLR